MRWPRVVLEKAKTCAGCGTWVATGQDVLRDPESGRIACDADCFTAWWDSIRDGMKS